jgi:cytidylate kinase
VRVIAIDGPAGAGKSTVARALAARLGLEYLDTGAMYRAVTLAALRQSISLTCEEALEGLLDTLRLEMPQGRVLLNGEDVSSLIRTSEITVHSAPIASNKSVRRRLVQWQRDIASGRDLVSEGRDQGTLVFPDAGCKFFLNASPEQRAERRWRELHARGEKVTLHEVLDAQEQRDQRDAARDIAPMKPADDAILVDTTVLTMDEVVDLMEREVRNRLPK